MFTKVAISSTSIEVAKAQSFRPIPASKETDLVIATELAKMNFTVPGIGINPLEQLESNAIISYSSPGYGDAVYLFHTISLLDPLKVSVPTTCSEQSFGKDGKWTEQVCSVYDVALGVCTNEENSCDPTKFPLIMAGKGINIKNNPAASSMLLCAFKNNYDFTQCQLPLNEAYSTQIANLIYVIDNTVPDGFDNVLLSNAGGFGNLAIDPNSHYVLGDGKLSLYESLSRSDKLMNLIIKNISGIMILAQNHLVDIVTEPHLNSLASDALKGYYSQKYSDLFFTKWEKPRFVNMANYFMETECGAIIGIIASARCGFEADQIFGFL